MKTKIKKSGKNRDASVLAMLLIAVLILTMLGSGLLRVAYGVRHRAIAVKNEAIARLTAEAGYENAILWMNQQPDLLSEFQKNGDHSGSISFANSNCDYTISFHDFIGSRPIYRIVSTGYCVNANRVCDVLAFQEIGGWEMGLCRVPSGISSTVPVYYTSGEIIDMPIHINCYGPADDSERDIHILGDPQFLQRVSMGEQQYSAAGADKYSDVMGLFSDGIYFSQPDSKITNSSVLQIKVDAFKATLQEQKPEFILTPAKNNNVPDAQGAVQLEFFVGTDGQGYVQITNNCTVRGYERPGVSTNTWDYQIDPNGDGSTYEKYSIYGYHYIPENAEATGQRYRCSIKSTEVTPSYGDILGEPGGQIFVEGNVVIGSNTEKASLAGIAKLNTVKGSITIVASGNIWFTNSIVVDGDHGADGMPSSDNQNAIGLIAQGLIKVVDPGMTEYSEVSDNGGSSDMPETIAGQVYEPIGWYKSGGEYSDHRWLPDTMVVEAAITVGRGGWGAENVIRTSYGTTYGGRKEWDGNQDDLVVRGTITEAIRGIVGLVDSDGYIKRYYFDKRLMQGLLPGNIWMKGKYVPTPAGWSDYSL